MAAAGAEPANAVVAEIAAANGSAVASVTDVSDVVEARQLIELPIGTWGKLDILVNCAGNFVRDTVADTSAENLATVGRVHMDGMLQTSTSRPCTGSNAASTGGSSTSPRTPPCPGHPTRCRTGWPRPRSSR